MVSMTRCLCLDFSNGASSRTVSSSNPKNAWRTEQEPDLLAVSTDLDGSLALTLSHFSASLSGAMRCMAACTALTSDGEDDMEDETRPTRARVASNTRSTIIILLVVTVADKLGYKFEGYEPLPMGSTSKIISYDYPSPSSSRLGAAAQRAGGAAGPPPPAPKKNVLELYSSGDITSHLPWNRKFDKGMIAFLELVRQLGAHVHQQTAQAQAEAGVVGAGAGADGEPAGAAAPAPLALPYKIDGDKIGDDRIGHFSIKLGLANNEEGWTKACKFALTCCKFLIAHASNVSHVANGR